MFPFALTLIAPLAMASSFVSAESIPVPGEDVPQQCVRVAEARKEAPSATQAPAATPAPAAEKKNKKETPRRWRLEAL